MVLLCESILNQAICLLVCEVNVVLITFQLQDVLKFSKRETFSSKLVYVYLNEQVVVHQFINYLINFLSYCVESRYKVN
jgi:hypothetical protein